MCFDRDSAADAALIHDVKLAFQQYGSAEALDASATFTTRPSPSDLNEQALKRVTQLSSPPSPEDRYHLQLAWVAFLNAFHTKIEGNEDRVEQRLQIAVTALIQVGVAAQRHQVFRDQWTAAAAKPRLQRTLRAALQAQQDDCRDLLELVKELDSAARDRELQRHGIFTDELNCGRFPEETVMSFVQRQVPAGELVAVKAGIRNVYPQMRHSGEFASTVDIPRLIERGCRSVGVEPLPVTDWEEVLDAVFSVLVRRGIESLPSFATDGKLQEFHRLLTDGRLRRSEVDDLMPIGQGTDRQQRQEVLERAAISVESLQRNNVPPASSN